LVSVPYYLCMFRGLDLSWWTEYAKQMTFWFGLAIGGLSLTDVAWNIKEGFKNGKGETK